MAILFDTGERPVGAMLHPTDLSEASQSAFHHALAMAIRFGASLTLLHAVGRRATDSWPGFPSVRDTLARWRAAGHTSHLEDRIKRAVISKIEVDQRDPVAASLKYLGRHSIDMVVVATEGRGGLSRLLRAPRAERLAREADLPTLFVPEGGRSFVDGATGEVSLSRILVPISESTDPRSAMLFAVRSAAVLDDPSLEITLLTVGGEEDAQLADVPQLPFCKWNVQRRPGEPVEQILAVADEIGADAIYMSTAWQRPAFGRVEGGVTERVLAEATCAVAAVPV